MTDQSEDAARRSKAAVWDLPVRVVHWALVGLIGFSWYAAKDGLMDWHRLSGYAVFGLLAFRVLWGFFGPSTARFASFVKGPRAVRLYVGTLRSRTTAGGVGHNPLGALSVIVLLLILCTQVGTGLFAVDVDGIESGPLSDWVSFNRGRSLALLHHVCFTALQVLVVLHVAAVLFYLVYKRDNLIWPMITGKRRSDAAGMTPASRIALVASIAVAGFLAWFASKGFRL